jgi:hypothetical protein
MVGTEVFETPTAFIYFNARAKPREMYSLWLSSRKRGTYVQTWQYGALLQANPGSG